jgi:hypothetical protein
LAATERHTKRRSVQGATKQCSVQTVRRSIVTDQVGLRKLEKFFHLLVEDEEGNVSMEEERVAFLQNGLWNLHC